MATGSGDHTTATEGYSNAQTTTNYKHSMQMSASFILGDEDWRQIIYQREAKVNPAFAD